MLKILLYIVLKFKNNNSKHIIIKKKLKYFKLFI